MAETPNELTRLMREHDADDAPTDQMARRINRAADEIDRLTLALQASEERAEKYERVLASSCDHLMEYAEWFGAMHIEECPEDDTCNCIHRPVNESISCLCVIAAKAKGNRDYAARSALTKPHTQQEEQKPDQHKEPSP